MTTQEQQPRGVHLVGSVPLPDAEAVFRMSASILGSHLRRLPDGETGERSNWIGWQHAVLAGIAEFEPVSERQFQLRTGVNSDTLSFGNLGYRDAALASYADFARLRRDHA